LGNNRLLKAGFCAAHGAQDALLKDSTKVFLSTCDSTLKKHEINKMSSKIFLINV
jgi:hypothetical protein